LRVDCIMHPSPPPIVCVIYVIIIGLQNDQFPDRSCTYVYVYNIYNIYSVRTRFIYTYIPNTIYDVQYYIIIILFTRQIYELGCSTKFQCACNRYEMYVRFTPIVVVGVHSTHSYARALTRVCVHLTFVKIH
jgi:hypothetical protein